ncbi:succinate CoA transferase [Mesonia phycicola]
MKDNRLLFDKYKSKIFSADKAAKLIRNGDVVGVSGFTKAGDSKAVLPAFAERAGEENLQITLITGASLGYNTDGALATNHALAKRMPFQADSTLRKEINAGNILYIDQHLSETAEQLHNGDLPKINIAIVEAIGVTEEGYLIPTTSVGNSATFLAMADRIIIEINEAVPLEFNGVHDIKLQKKSPNREILEVTSCETRVGDTYIKLDPNKVEAIVYTNKPDAPARIADPDKKTISIAKHLMQFFEKEVEEGKLTKSLLPLQAGIGKIANAVLAGFLNSPFEDLKMYSEVLQDSTFQLIDAGKMNFASASSITVSEECYANFIKNFKNYKDKIVLRPQNISNSAEVIRRLGIIAINTAIEFDIYGNVNSTHLTGTRMMNGIGGSGDFARNAHLSIFVCPSISKEGRISHVVPMVSHTDHTEHDVDILVTDQGLADLRNLAPRERAQKIIDNCVHPAYKEQMQSYFDRAKLKQGHTPHILQEAFSWHTSLDEEGTMQLQTKAESLVSKKDFSFS